MNYLKKTARDKNDEKESKAVFKCLIRKQQKKMSKQYKT